MSKQIISEEFKRMQKLAGITNENTYKPKYTESEASKLFDYHERTGMLPDDVTKEEYDELMSYYNIKRDNDDDFTDPAGGSGIYSHI
jgi:hypothetical protein